MGQERLGPSYFFISLVLGPLNSHVPSLRYTRSLGWRMHCGAEVTESSTNKQHHLSYGTYLPQGIYGAWVLFFVSTRTNKRHHHHTGMAGLSAGSLKQRSVSQSVSLSTAKSEWYTASEPGKELLYLRIILREFGFSQLGPFAPA